MFGRRINSADIAKIELDTNWCSICEEAVSKEFFGLDMTACDVCWDTPDIE